MIYIDRGLTPKAQFEDKFELTPLQFPRLWASADLLQQNFGAFETRPGGLVAKQVQIGSDVAWEQTLAENVYCIIPGKHPERQKETILVEAFYDSSQWVFGRSPGADEASGIAGLLDLAQLLLHQPPDRTFLLVATAGHAQSLAGMRELIWSLTSKSKAIKGLRNNLLERATEAEHVLGILENAPAEQWLTNMADAKVRDAINEQIKTEVNQISQRLMRLRLQADADQQDQTISQLAARRFKLRRLVWQTDTSQLSLDQQALLFELVPRAISTERRLLEDVQQQLRIIKSTRRIRAELEDRKLILGISLHLSSNGDGFGAFDRGWTYALRPKINRWRVHRQLDAAMKAVAAAEGHDSDLKALLGDTLRPSRLRSWDGFFLDRPALGGEVSAMAGLMGISLVMLNDARPAWGTPYDTPERIDWDFARKQSRAVSRLIAGLGQQPKLSSGKKSKRGFATLDGRVNFIRHGELFPDQPAPGTVLMIYQGPVRFYTMVDSLGQFHLRGLANKKHVYDKAIIEGYRFDPVSGEVLWAIDKKQTGKPAYRVKMQRRDMETDLVMFDCRQTTLYGLLEPRSFQYMKEIQLIDGRREATPLRYWYSRINTRDSTLLSTYLPRGTRLKMTLSDTVRQKKLVLTNASTDLPQGSGYLVDQWPAITRTAEKIARDMWALLSPRIQNLERHGIFDEKLRDLTKTGREALAKAQTDLAQLQYDSYHRSVTKAWALASRAYRQVDEVQKDVLYGVLFYIALFVPFAFCLERLLFSYADIHKRLIAFAAILIFLIAIIYQVHPAFQLAYSPSVVILAFLIMGLSLIVTLIIFFRFEQEMIQLQSRAAQLEGEQVSRWKAFAAAFFLGVSNLRRRRIRTVLTCLTLVILTFTIMSFTAVKSIRHQARVLYKPTASYEGYLIKNVNWKDIPIEALATLQNSFGSRAVVAPRVWFENQDRIRATTVPVRSGSQTFEAQALVGLAPEEPQVTGIDRIISAGRWFDPEDSNAVLLPLRMAAELGITPESLPAAQVTLWGMPFKVIGLFSGEALGQQVGLDGESATPITFPSEAAIDITEVEMEAIESGEDIQSFQSRYRHTSADLTLIVPARTLLAYGGRFKGVAVRIAADTTMAATAWQLVDRYRLVVFSGEPDGTFLYNVSDAISYSGVPNILIPIVISICIVLNTMISSVYERKREIGIYTSVGLAPSHVSFLFIAESLAFAVLSVVLGYLLAQTSASLFAQTPLWAGITVNYSSLAGVAAMMLVILVVLVSTLYPSRVAAQIAIPDVYRSWKLPDPKQNEMLLTLPFLIKTHEMRSAGGFIYDYFKRHEDVSHGLFSTADTHFELMRMTSQQAASAAGSGICMRIATRSWLAPFDFGIMQRVEVIFQPAAGEPAFLEMHARLVRESGEAVAWGRVNKAFINRLRKQLLMWRAMDDDGRDVFKRNLAVAQQQSTAEDNP